MLEIYFTPTYEKQLRKYSYDFVVAGSKRMSSEGRAGGERGCRRNPWMSDGRQNDIFDVKAL